MNNLLNSIDEFIKLAKVFGPYKNKLTGRQIVIIKNDDGTSRTVSFPKYLMEQHLGYELDPNLHTIDHIDYNKDNNDLSNFRIVERSQHSADDTRRVKLIKLKCDNCGKIFERSPRVIRDKATKGTAFSACSRSCSGSLNRKLQLKQVDKNDLNAPSHIESEYYRRKIEEKKKLAFFDYIILKYG